MSPHASDSFVRFAALVARVDAHSDTIERLCWGAPQGLPGVIADAFGPLLVVTLYQPGAAEVVDACVGLLDSAWAGRPFLVKARTAGEAAGYEIRSSSVPLPESLTAQEAGVRFEIRTDPRHDFGVFPDAARARAAVRAEAKGRKALNLFAYTCGFALAALKGGAAEACNVDPNRDYLTWGKRNATLNGVDFRVLPDTGQAFLRRLERRREKGEPNPFDLVVADPPAFGVGRDSDRILRTFWPEMADHFVRMAPACLVLLFNDRYFRQRVDLERFVHEKFGSAYEAEWLEALPEGLPEVPDPFYVPPRTVVLRRRAG